ncbi:MAG: type IV conjugative transfer system protein TraE [Gammaproteobacteria bacterium]|nr:type IV conjugative transfer system protein TraE [Gammaproteobacteria bacterium]
MEYQIAQNKLQILSGRLHYLLLISVGLLISNIFLVWLVGWSFAHQKRTIVPADMRQSFTVSDSTIDASYLRQMALFFIAERLNITPSNIDQNHSIILQYTDSRFYHKFVDILDKERQAIIKQNISSVFYPEEVIPNTKELSVLTNGSLIHWVGNMALAPAKKSYIVKFSYRSGYLKVLSFSEITEIEQAEGAVRIKKEDNNGN